MFDPVDPKASFPELERGILQYWKEEDMFRRSIQLRDGCEEFGFYDGPPFATGLPHYGHLLAGTIKDVIPRYQTMRGKKVQRRFGWDCHGLPIENLIEKENDIKGKPDIEAMGVKRFNELCRASVQRYAKEWRMTVERVGRWVDMDWDYKTMDAPFMESIWWVFKQLADKNLIYEGHKPMHICPRCVTPLSNFEVTLGYKDVTDHSATVQFEIYDDSAAAILGRSTEGKTYLLAWTTTPWTLPGNLFVAVGAELSYVKVVHNNNTYIVAKERAESVFKDKEYKVDGKPFKGKKLEGMTYSPLFPYFTKEYGKKAFRVVLGDFVTTDEGTGLVHIAPGFGEDDFNVGEREKVPLLQHVSIEGKFVDGVTDFKGEDVKPSDDPAKTDRKIVDWLEKQGLLFSKESYRHSYPHCWRCDSPLLNYATSSWFVKVEAIKEDMLKANAQTEWVPAHLRDGRFGNWLENARDWAISRNRYWGTPLPIWRSKDTGEIDVIASRSDLMERNRIRFTRVTTLRHGEAEHNVGGFYQSEIPGVHLTDTGKKQAKRAAEYLATQKVDVIYCSPLNRTLETAQAIADATGAQIIVDERLREVNVGDYERKAFDLTNLTQLVLRRKKKMQEGSPVSPYHLEGMEKWTDIYARNESFLKEMLPKHRSEHVVVVTHGDLMDGARHFFTREDPYKLSYQPSSTYATPETWYWDHDADAQMDLHKEWVDDIMWPSPDAKKTVNATFVRHGETDLNLQGIVQGGNIDASLNETGRKQALELAAKLKGQSFDVVITSDLKRAAETADILTKELHLPNAILMPEFRERHMGSWSGQPGKDVAESLGEGKRVINLALHDAVPEDGESLDLFLNRIRKGHEKIVTAHAGKRVLIVCHRGVIQAERTIVDNLSHKEALAADVGNGEAVELTLKPFMKRIPEVLDCWFESGSMPYAEKNFPFNFQFSTFNSQLPPAFPADFIAEGVDQTRGWFYTLTVLASALYQESPFRNCVVNGTVLAEDGLKMSKKLRNYPDPNEVMEKHGADALRFSLMNSPAVRAEDLRFSEKVVEETVRSVILPLWNSYSFFVTYANLAHFEPSAKAKSSSHPLDRWIKAEMQDLVNRMTEQLDNYDLSATCEELFETIDALTNWYIRLSRRRFAGKGSTDVPEAEPENFEQDRVDALNTLYDVLITVSQLLAPFCPFTTDAIYLNLVSEEHGSIHLTDWPEPRKLKKEEQALITQNRLLRTIVSLGLKIRSDKTIKVRTPLASATVAFPPGMLGDAALNDEQLMMLRQELNVKDIRFTDDPGTLAERFAMVDARKAGPRLGKLVQDVIQAGKRGEFEILPDGRIAILDETLGPDEVQILYRGTEGQDVAGEKGIVVSLDTAMTDELQLEGVARDLIRAIQKLRKDQGYALGEQVKIGIQGADDVLKTHQQMIEQEASVTIGTPEGSGQQVEVGDAPVTIFMHPKS